jgi:hypothetical protein
MMDRLTSQIHLTLKKDGVTCFSLVIDLSAFPGNCAIQFEKSYRAGFEPATLEGLKLIGKLTHTQRTASIDYGSKGGAFSNPIKRDSILYRHYSDVITNE